MADRWFRIPETGDGTTLNTYRPDYVQSMGLAFSGAKSHPDGAPVWVVCVYGSSDDLNTLAGKAGVQELSRSEMKSAIDKIHGVNRTADEWNSRYRIEP